jgi:uncharacterized repeat protein (TIGR01451 family)
MWTRNDGTVTDTFKLSYTSSVPGVTVSFVKDDNGDSIRQAEEVTPMDTVSAAPGTRNRGFFAVSTDETAPAGVAVITITAQSKADPSKQAVSRGTITISVPLPDLRLTLASDKQAALPGQTITLTVTAQNQGDGPARGVEVTIKLPEYTEPAGELKLAFGDIEPGAQAVKTVELRVL